MKKNKGFTLIELLISIAILSILTIAFSKVSISSIKGNSKNNIDIVAMNIAQSEIENIRSQMKEYKNSSYTPPTSEDENDKNKKKLSILLTSVDGKVLKYESNEFDMTRNNNSYKVLIDVKEAIIEGQKYKELYEVRVEVKSDKEYFSRKSTELITQIRLNTV